MEALLAEDPAVEVNNSPATPPKRKIDWTPEKRQLLELRSTNNRIEAALTVTKSELVASKEETKTNHTRWTQCRKEKQHLSGENKQLKRQLQQLEAVAIQQGENLKRADTAYSAGKAAGKIEGFDIGLEKGHELAAKASQKQILELQQKLTAAENEIKRLSNATSFYQQRRHKQ